MNDNALDALSRKHLSILPEQMTKLINFEGRDLKAHSERLAIFSH